MTFKPMFDGATLRKQIKNHAKLVLSNKSVYLNLLFATVTALSAYVISETLKICFYLVFSCGMDALQATKFETLLNALFIIPRFFILSPLFVGLYALAIRVSRGHKITFSFLFSYYSSPKLILRSWAASAIINVPFTLLSLILMAIRIFFKYFPQFSGSINALNSFMSVKDLVYILYAVFSLCVLAWSTRLFGVLNAIICGGDQSLSLCVLNALKKTRKKSRLVLLFVFSFTGWILLSFLTVGILFVVFTIPYFVVSQSYYTTYILTGEYRTCNLEEQCYEQ